MAATIKPRHTPGPWEVVQPDADNPSRAMVCGHQVNIYNAPLTGETQANARLIAAAPELLMACKALVAALEHGAVSGRLVDAAREKIAKAEGR